MNNTGKWIFGLVAVGVIGAWLLDKPDPRAKQRESACKSWGIKDKETLAGCRQSDGGMRAAIGPIKRPLVERQIAEFN